METTNLVHAPAPSIKELAEKLKGKTVWDLLVMDWVKDRFVRNHNLINKDGNGELAYQRQVLVYKSLLEANEQLARATVDSHYRCLIQASARGWSLDPADNQVYVLAYKDQATLQPQAGAHVARLIKTGQAEYAEQAQLVYDGDTIEVENGAVKKHVRKFASTKIKLGFVKIVRTGSSPNFPKESFFIYTPANWNAWRKKSKQQNSENWTGGEDGQPVESFLKTKIVLHATKEKCWASGETNLFTERYDDSEWNDEIDSINDSDDASQDSSEKANNNESFEPYETVKEEPAKAEEIKW